ncbi:AAA family ATPase [Bradyrhizobium sp. 13971]
MFCERDGGLVRTEVATFRPIRDAGGTSGREDADHYAWLAYEPENLILICIECSSRRRTEFPVVGERAPYLAAMEEVRRRERPLTVDPYRGQPDRHFVFLTDGRVEGTTAEGHTTIALLGLDDGYLLKHRRADIGKLLDELRGAITETRGNSIPDMLRRARPFAGARMGIVRRLFEGMEVAGERLQGSAATFRQRLERALVAAEQPDRSRLLARIDTLVAEDGSRQIERSIYQPQDYDPVAADEHPRAQPPTGGIARVEFVKFKGLEGLVLETISGRTRSKGTPCLMLLGENSVGKSSILQGIALALIGEREARRLKIDPSDLLHADRDGRWDQLTPDDARVRIDFRLSGRSTEFVLDSMTRRVHGDPRPAGLVLGYGPHRYFDPRRSDRPDADYARVRTLFHPTAALPYPSTWLNALDSHKFNEVAKVLRVVLALNDADEVVRDVDGRICVALDGAPVPVERLSEGYRSIFAMIVDIARELMREFRYLEDAEAIVLIDEIDTHLHPRWKMRVMGALRRALPRVQFIVTTHDPLCLRGMEDGEVIVLQRDEVGQIISLPDLPSIKGMRADQLLTSDFFGLSSTVDPETELDVARFVEAVGDLPAARVEEANRLVRQLVLGDDALEQVVQEALARFLSERERPTGALRTDVRAQAVQTILNALRSDGARGPDAETLGS